jgi:hypothetical protein
MLQAGVRSSDMSRAMSGLTKKSQESINQLVALNAETTMLVGSHLAKALELYELQVVKKFFRNQPSEDLSDMVQNWLQEFVYAHNDYRIKLRTIFDDLHCIFYDMNVVKVIVDHTAAALDTFPKTYPSLVARGQFHDLEEILRNIPEQRDQLTPTLQNFRSGLNLNPQPDNRDRKLPREDITRIYQTRYGYSQPKVKNLSFLSEDSTQDLLKRVSILEGELQAKDRSIQVLEKENLNYLKRLQQSKAAELTTPKDLRLSREVHTRDSVHEQTRDRRDGSSTRINVVAPVTKFSEDIEVSDAKVKQLKDSNKSLLEENVELQRKVKRQNELILTLQLKADLEPNTAESRIQANDVAQERFALTRHTIHTSSSTHFGRVSEEGRILAYLPIHADEPQPLSSRRQSSADLRQRVTTTNDRLSMERIQQKVAAQAKLHLEEIEELRRKHREEVESLKIEIKSLKDRITEDKERYSADMGRFRESQNRLLEKEINERIKEVEEKALRTLSLKDHEMVTEREHHLETVKLLQSQVKALQISLKEFKEVNQQYAERENQIKRKFNEDVITIEEIEELREKYELEKQSLKELHKLELEAAVKSKAKELNASYTKTIHDKDVEIALLRKSSLPDWELKLSELQANNSSLERRIKSKSAQIVALEEEIADLKRRMHEFQYQSPSKLEDDDDREGPLIAQLGVLQTKIGELSTELLKSEAQISTLKEENHKLTIKLQSAEDSKTHSQRNQRFDYDRLIQETEEYKRRLEEEKRYQEEDRKKLEDDYKKRESDIRKRYDDEIRELHDRIDGLGSEQRRNLDGKLHDLEALLAKKAAEYMQLKSEHQRALNDAQRKAEASIQTMTLELSLFKAKYEVKEKDLKDKERDFKEREQELKREVEACKDSERRRVEDILRDKLKNEEHFRDRERDRERERLKLLSEIEKLNLAIKDNEAIIKRREDDMRAIQLRLNDELESAKRHSSNSEFHSKQLILDLETRLSEQQSEAARKLANLEREHSGAIKAVQIELEYSRSSANDLTVAKQNLQTQLESKKKEYDNTVANLEKEIVLLKEELDILTRGLNESQNQLSLLENRRQEEVSQYLDQISRLKEEYEVTKKSSLGSNLTVRNLQRELDNLMNTHSNLEMECTSLKQKLADALGSLQEEREISSDLREQMAADKLQFTERINELSAEISKHKGIIMNRMNEVKALKELRESELANFSQSVAEFNQQMENERQVFNEQVKNLDNEKRKQLDLLNNKIHELVAQQDIQKIQLKRDLDNEKADRIKLETDYSIKNSQMTKLINEYMREIDQLKLENFDLRSNIDDPKRGIDHLSHIDIENYSAEKSLMDPFRLTSKRELQSSGNKFGRARPPIDTTKIQTRSFTQISKKNKSREVSPEEKVDRVDTRGRSGTGPLSPIRQDDFENVRPAPISTSAFVTNQVTKITTKKTETLSKIMAPENVSSGNITEREPNIPFNPARRSNNGSEREIDQQYNSFGAEGSEIFDSYIKKSHITTSVVGTQNSDDGIKPKEFTIIEGSSSRLQGASVKTKKPTRALVTSNLKSIEPATIREMLKTSESVSFTKIKLDEPAIRILTHWSGLVVLQTSSSKTSICALGWNGQSVEPLATDRGNILGWVDGAFSEDGRTVTLVMDGNFDLVQYDTRLNEIRSYQGSPVTFAAEAEIFRNTQSERKVKQMGGRSFLWMSSPTNLCVVDLESFKKIEIPNFWSTSVYVLAAASTDCRRFFGVGVSTVDYTAGNERYILHWLDIPSGGAQSSAPLSSVTGALVKKPLCVDYWQESPYYVLLCGASADGKGAIDVLSISANSLEVTQSIITSEPIKSICTWHDQGLVVVGCLSSVQVFSFRTSQQKLIEHVITYDQLSISSEIRDIKLINDTLLCSTVEGIFRLDILKPRQADLYQRISSATNEVNIPQPLSPVKINTSNLKDRATWMKIIDSTMYLRLKDKLASFDLTATTSLDADQITTSALLSFQDLTRCRNGRHLYITAEGNVLKLATSSLAQISSQSPLSKQQYALETVSYLNLQCENGFVLWPCGKGVLAVVNCENLEIERVGGLGGIGGGQPLCYLTATSQNTDKIVTVSLPHSTGAEVNPSSPPTPFFSYWQRSSGVDRAVVVPGERILARLSSVSGIEVSHDGSFLVFTGKVEATPVVGALTLDGYFDFLGSVAFDTEVHAVRRISNGNVFAIGGHGKLTFVRFGLQDSPGGQTPTLGKPTLANYQFSNLGSLQLPENTGVIGRIGIFNDQLHLFDREAGKIITIQFPSILSTFV